MEENGGGVIDSYEEEGNMRMKVTVVYRKDGWVIEKEVGDV